MLHYHPLVIYRFQVLKQADVVLALFLQGDRFTIEQKRADFEYYDPITTGDSTLSAIVQAVLAAEVGYHEAALHYFNQALYVDLLNLHANTIDGLHVASAGGVWSVLVFGFGGMRDYGGALSFDPRLPKSWPLLRFRFCWRGSRVLVELTQDQITFTMVESGPDVTLSVRGTAYSLTPEATLVVALDGQGDRIDGLLGDQPVIGGKRADGSTITAGVPEPIQLAEDVEATGELPAYVPDPGVSG
jgi:alpha,alpha-trehalose phosphorylase